MSRSSNSRLFLSYSFRLGVRAALPGRPDFLRDRCGRTEPIKKVAR
jgi:hypothetical protein